MRAEADEPASPCTRVCTLDPFDRCLGCERRLDEIVGWGRMSAQCKRAVLAALPARRAARMGR